MATGAPNGANKRTKSYSVNCGKEDDLRQIVNILVAAAQRNPVTQLRPTPASHMASKPYCMKQYTSHPNQPNLFAVRIQSLPL